MQTTVRALKSQVHRQSLYTLAKGVSSFHRVQASGGFKAAADWCAAALNARGVEARVLEYPARAGGFAGSYRLFQQWDCRAAWCRLAWPEKLDLADYGVEPVSIIQKSAPCDWRTQPLELVEMTEGCDPSAYEGWELAGRVLFTHQHINKFAWAIQQRGALGLVSDYLNDTPYVRCPEELFDTLNYTSFWWKHTPEEKRAFGFVVTPRVSQRLHAACQKARAEHEAGRAESPYPRLNAWVDSTLADGASHVVEAVLPGKERQAVLAVAHLCHPCASANDNASGVAGAIEALAAIRSAVERGLLPPPEKTIRLILVPEFTGTYNYLNDGRDRAQYLAGINLDMIGARQQGTTGPITLTGLPWACPSFVGDLATLLMQEVKGPAASRDDLLLAHVLTKQAPFGLGSDHFILSDPAVGVPCPMLGQWPDAFYHTSSDTLERLDLDVLRYSTLVAAGYLYTLASFTLQDAQLVWNHQRTRLMAEAERIRREGFDQGGDGRQTEQRLAALKTFYKGAAASVQRFAPGADPGPQLAWMDAALPGAFCPAPGGPVWRRRFADPIESLENLLLDQPQQLALARDYEAKHADEQDREMLEALCGYYIDGTRTENEVIAWVLVEQGGQNSGLLREYMQLLAACGLLERAQE